MLSNKTRHILFFILILLTRLNLSSQDIQINEVCASNLTILVDENNESPDWIELYNPGPGQINLSGYALSDNQDSLRKWIFPDFIMDPENYLVVFASGKGNSDPPTFWNSLITEGDEWKYIIPSSEPSPLWRSDTGFNDSGWNSGPTGIGYGDGDDATEVGAGTISVFMRKKFNISDTSGISEFILSIDYDDAFVAYLNGTEICRANIGSPGTPPAYNDVADTYIEPVMIFGGKPFHFNLTEFIELLHDGENLLAIQLHNQSTGSSDLTMIPFLSFSSQMKYLPDPEPVLGFISSSFHTNFKLNKDGDSLYLSNPAGELVDFFPISYNPIDVSLGYPDDTGPEIKAFTEPTPWLSNTTQAYFFNGPKSLTFSHPSGYYQNPINLSLTSVNPQDNIYYTTDGTDPDTDSKKYSSPITILGTNTIKARIINPGYLPGEIVTGSYFTKTSSGLPTIFITTDPYNLWDVDYGIYAEGNNASNDFPYFGANFWEDWERPAYLEYFSPDGQEGFKVNAGIKIFGGWSRGHPMKSISIFARNVYGDRNISYRVFENKDLDKFEALVLRNGGNDWFGMNNESGVLFRDLLMTGMTQDMNVDFQAGKPAVVYINGQYWGIHNIREKVNEHYISSNHSNIDPDRIHLLMANKNVIQGSNSDYAAIETFIRSNSLSIPSNYEYIKTKIDIDNFVNYEVAQIYYFNGDWPGNNIKFWRFDPSYSKWRWIIYDTDFGFGLWDANKVYYNSLDFATTTTGDDWPNPPWSTFMLRELLKNTEFKNLFINTFADRMNTVFEPIDVNARIDYYKNLFDDEMTYHISRWGGNKNNWYSNINALKEFSNNRPAAMRSIIRTFFGINQSKILTVRIAGVENAKVNLNSLILDGFPWTGYYFEGIPVRLRAIAPEGYMFERWEGELESTEQEIEYDMLSSGTLTAVFKPYSPGPYEGVIINEISYNNPDGTRDWVEIYNNSSETKDISGWSLKDSDTDHYFRIADRTLLLPYDYLVLTEDMESFFNLNPGLPNVTGNTQFGFNRLGECIRLYDSEMNIVDSVCFASEYPWPESPLETGYPIALRNPDSDNTQGYNWSSAIDMSGTPGSSNMMQNTNFLTDEVPGEGLHLYQNFPNPFSEQTTIAFRINTPSEIKISIYDLNGRLTDVVFEGFLPEGHHEFNWSAGSNATGIYILNVQDENATYRRKMLLGR